MIRIGHGFDVHKFGDGDHVVLGGVNIPYQRAFIAHSDGDVLIHAVCDALLGAMALGDIGSHFPDHDEAYKNIDSRVLLRRVFDLVRKHAYRINNLDITIIAQEPKMQPFREAMRSHLAEDLHIALSQVNVKATTTEGLGYCGRKEGVAVHAVVIIESAS